LRVLSLFDGMSCGMIAMLNAGVEVESYDAYEIDKYAIQVSKHNFPIIKQHGDVFNADFAEYADVDFLVGGSPCTYWSIAQKNNRETEASGLGWELFSQYVRALREAKPKYFLYENNKSMSKEIRASIDDAFGFEAVLINSALVSAQNRQRLYWVGKRNEDGTYSKVNVEQPKDRGILLKDVLDSAVAWREKSYCIDANYYKGGNLTSFTKQSDTRFMAAEPINTTDDKARTIRATCYKDGIRNLVGNDVDKRTCVAEPVGFSMTGTFGSRNASVSEKAYCLAANPSSDMSARVVEPIRIGCMPSPDGTIKNSQGMRLYSVEGKAINQTANGGGMGAKTGLYAEPIEVAELSDEYYHGDKNGQLFGKIVCKNTSNNKGQPAQGTRIYNTDCKSICLDGDSRKYIIDKITTSDGKSYPIYEVKDGQITIKGKQYPIKLADGYYIIRKLTVNECKRLQTVPDWYDFSVISNSQAYKCLGNGWTCDVITHLIKSALNQKTSQA